MADLEINDQYDFFKNVVLDDTGAMKVKIIDPLVAGLDNRIIVNQTNFSTILGGAIDSTKEYFIDGIVDIGTTQITIPSTGITLKGYNFDLSALTSSENSYTMFISEVGGSGNVLGADYYISVTGTASKVYDIVSLTGNEAFEFSKVNYIDCTSLGVIDNYRQGLEVGSGRFGGSPSLELKGAWLGGFRVSTSIVRGLSAGMTEPLFKAGTGFTMGSRFLTDINVDLPTSAAFLDFSDTNFPIASSLELRDVLITRNGATVPTDTNLTPNIEASNLSCSWKDNNGIPNTFVGGISTISTEIETALSGGNPSPILGTFTNTDLQHFDSPSNGQLRHLGNNPKEYTVNFDFVLEGGASDEYKIELVLNDGSDTVIYQQTRVIANSQGGRDVTYFTGFANAILNQNEYLFWQVTNITDNTNCTLELSSSYSVKER